MRSAHADAELASRQLSLVTALVAGGSPPAGVDPERVRIQALALVRKRSRSVARHQPELAASLGADFWPAFQRYTAADPTPPANTSSDAKRFARYVRSSRRSRLVRLFLPSSRFAATSLENWWPPARRKQGHPTGFPMAVDKPG